MKKIFALFVAVAALMVWTLPATAGVDFGGQYRIRGEQKSNYDFSDDKTVPSSTDDDQIGFYGQRVRLWGVAKPTNDTTVKITIQDTRNWGANQTATVNGPNLTDTGVNTLDLHESYVLIDEFFGTPFSVKIGRQELVYGDQRLVGAFGWSNNGRSFDAAKTMYRSDAYDVDFVVSKVRDSNTGAAKNDNDEDFYILHGTVKTIPNNSLDLYAMLLRDGGTGQFITNNTTGVGVIDESQNLWTYGARLKGAVAGIDYTAEYVIQKGEINTVAGSTDYDIDADAFALRLGYTIPGGPMGLRVGAEYAYASGDDNPTDNDMETFSNLFPTNHGHYGNADQQAWRNMKAWNVNASIKPNAKTSVKLSYWDFALDEDKDGWYGAGTWNNAATGLRSGVCLDAAGAQCDDEVGTELDLSVKYKYNSAVTIMAGVSRFFAGDRIEDYYQGTYGGGTSADTEDLDYAWVQLTANF